MVIGFSRVLPLNESHWSPPIIPTRFDTVTCKSHHAWVCIHPPTALGPRFAKPYSAEQTAARPSQLHLPPNSAHSRQQGTTHSPGRPAAAALIQRTAHAAPGRSQPHIQHAPHRKGRRAWCGVPAASASESAAAAHRPAEHQDGTAAPGAQVGRRRHCLSICCQPQSGPACSIQYSVQSCVMCQPSWTFSCSCCMPLQLRPGSQAARRRPLPDTQLPHCCDCSPPPPHTHRDC
jgi:hypothetical protein